LGEGVFFVVGCEGCHRSLLRTGPNAVAALNKVYFRPFSDFLLHDMGSLGDGITSGVAGPRLMRTAPLWGVRGKSKMLHDGRATTIAEAVGFHDGQGAAARNAFAALTATQQAQIVAFLMTR